MSRRALVIGINSYKDQDINDLKGGCNDAQEVRDLLVEYGDFEISDKHYLPDEHATSDAIMEGVSDLLWEANPCDLILVYFSGHGFVDNYGTGYLAPHDMDLARPLVKGIKMQDIKNLALRSENKKNVILILDCCYSGVMAKGDKDISQSKEVSEKMLNELQTGLDTEGAGTIILTSSSANQKSRERNDCEHMWGTDEPHCHGEFTFHLLEALTGGAKKNQDGWVTVPQLITYVKEQLEDIPTQSARFFGADLGDLNKITLARPMLQSNTVTKLDDIINWMNSGELMELIYAVGELNALYQVSPKYQPVLDAKAELDSKLKNAKSRSMAWMLDNMIAISREAPGQYQVMIKMVNNLSFDELAKSQDSCNLMGCLFTAVEKKMELDSFIGFLRSDAHRKLEQAHKEVPEPGQGRNE